MQSILHDESSIISYLMKCIIYYSPQYKILFVCLYDCYFLKIAQ